MSRNADRLRRCAVLSHDVLMDAADELEQLSAKRTPLSKDAVLRLIAQYPTDRLQLARAVEAAHGIVSEE